MAQKAPRLSKREREILELVMQGMSMDRLAKTLQESPKVVERYLHQGLYKLESWSQEAAPGPTYNSGQDRELGFLRPRQAEREVARIIRAVGSNWACVVMLAIPDAPRSRDSGAVADGVGRHIFRSLRGQDVVTKWSSTEWVIFLPRIERADIEKVVRRLEHGHNSPWAVYVMAGQPTGNESFHEVAQNCHQQLLSQYITRDLAAYVKPLADMP